jgi:predicted naringenin-chalcone synthase
VLANALFADGAAAVIGQTACSSSEEDSWQLRSSASTVLPQTTDLMSWQIGDHGFEMTLSPEVPILIEERLHDWIAPWLAGCGLALEDIGSWAIHPGGPKILQATAAAAGFDRSLLADSEDILARYGNMSSPTILFILDRLRRRNAPRPCVGIAFGPGLTIEAALFV